MQETTPRSNQISNSPIKLYIADDDQVMEATVSMAASARGLIVFVWADPRGHSLDFPKLSAILQSKGFSTIQANVSERARDETVRMALPTVRRRLSILFGEIECSHIVNRLPIGVVCEGAAGTAIISLATHDLSAVKALVLYDSKPSLAQHDLAWLSTATLFLTNLGDAHAYREAREACVTALHAPTKTVEIGANESCDRVAREIAGWLEAHVPETA